MSHIVNPHVVTGLRYARSIVNGKIPACKWARLCCQRQLDDLVMEKDPSFPYRFDKVKAERVCRFMEKLPHIKGELAGQKLILQPFQMFRWTTVFGWVRKSDGMRRFNRVFVRESRKNGKSTEAAAVGVYMVCGDGENGAEVYAGATSEDQALMVFRPAWLMVAKTPALQHHFGIQLSGSPENPNAIFCPETGSRFEAIIGKPGEGANVHCAITDEYHEHVTSEQFDAMNTGMGSRRQPLHIIITTAGTNLASPCYDLDVECQKILEKKIVKENVFCIQYGLDEADDWMDWNNWIKANPNFGISVKEEFLRSQWHEALTNVSRQNTLRTKHLDEWCNARSPWMNMALWDKCKDVQLNPDDVAEHPVYLGVDLASKIDLAAVIQVHVALLPDAPGASEQPEDDDDEAGQPVVVNARKYRRHYWAFSHFYCPESQAHDPKNTHYAGWEHDEVLTVTEGDEISFPEIGEDIREDICGPYDVREVAYDPWRATQLAQELATERIETVEVRPLVANFSPAMKELTAAIKARRFHHDGNPILTWCVSNVLAYEDKKGEFYPNKEKHGTPLKIDGAIALLMAVSRAMVSDLKPKKKAWNGVVETW